MKNHLYWNTRNVPKELHSSLKTLAEEYHISEKGTRGLELCFQQSTEDGLCQVEILENRAEIVYTTPAQAIRGVGALLGGIVKPSAPYREHTTFKSFGIMLDCSRNAVMKVDHIKQWLRRLSLLGYNMVMLYTEDVYELEGEPWFSYQRGAYTKSELKEIDAYASLLNIELIPCIQTLGHLLKVLRRKVYQEIRDVPGVLLVGEKKTYALIEKMIKHWKECCKTDRIHIGMDETHGLGTGKYQELHGKRSPFDIFNEHLKKVSEICKKHGLKPMIWSDMYFTFASKTNTQYDTKAVIPKKVVNDIDKNVEFVFWDYYNDNEEFYTTLIKKHRAMGKEPVMGSGIWTWNKFWHDQYLTEKNAGPCIEACIKNEVKEIFFTQWGDNGAYCDHDSAFAGMAWCAEKGYGHTVPNLKILESRFAAICKGSYADHVMASGIHNLCGPEAAYVLWDDPLFNESMRNNLKDDPRKMISVGQKYQKLTLQLDKCKKSGSAGDLRYAHATARAIADRYLFIGELIQKYRKKDKKGMTKLASKVPAIIANVKKLEKTFRTMWMSHNKPEGIEMMQQRFGAMQVRYKELQNRLVEYTNGEVKVIAEFEYRRPPS